MTHHHERQVCRCGATVMQCRCMAPKTDRVVCESCPKCQRATTAALAGVDKISDSPTAAAGVGSENTDPRPVPDELGTDQRQPFPEPPTFKSTLRALYDRRSKLFTAARLETLTAEGAAEAASIEAQIDVLELAEAIVQGTFDRAAEAEGQFRDVADGLLEAVRVHEEAISGASIWRLLKRRLLACPRRHLAELLR